MESAEDGGGGVLLCHCVVVVCGISSEGVAFQATSAHRCITQGICYAPMCGRRLKRPVERGDNAIRVDEVGQFCEGGGVRSAMMPLF